MPRLKEYPAVFSRGQTIEGVKYNKGDPHPAAGLNTNKFKVDGSAKDHWRTKKPKVKGKLAKAEEELAKMNTGERIVLFLEGSHIKKKDRRREAKKIPTKLKLEDFKKEKIELKPEFAHLEDEQITEEMVDNYEKYYDVGIGEEIDHEGAKRARNVEIEGNINLVAKHRLTDLLSTKTGKARERGLRADYGYTQTQWKQKKEFEAMISKGNIAEAVAKTQQSPPPQMLGTITPLAVSHSIEPNLQPILKQEFYTDKEGKEYDKKLFKPQMRMVKGKARGIKYVKR